MARIDPLKEVDAGAESREALRAMASEHGRVTNMKGTLARSPVALRALMTWYDLRAEVIHFLGDRLTILFAHAVSNETECLVCSTFFRRLLIDAGENPDALRLDDRERLVVAFGRQLGRTPHTVDDEVFEGLAGIFAPEQIVTLTAFGGLMVATNLFNNAIRVDLDEYLWPYRAVSQEPKS